MGTPTSPLSSAHSMSDPSAFNVPPPPSELRQYTGLVFVPSSNAGELVAALRVYGLQPEIRDIDLAYQKHDSVRYHNPINNRRLTGPLLEESAA